MGMGNPLDCLRRTVTTLEKTWQAWFDGASPKDRKELEENFEHLLSEAETFLGYVKKEWRGAFKKPKKVKYNDRLQHAVVDKFVPSWKR